MMRSGPAVDDPMVLGWEEFLARGDGGDAVLDERLAALRPDTVSTFIYITLLTHSTGGYLVFGQLPDAWTLGGAVIVVLSGLYLFHRERITMRAAAVAMTAEAAKQR